MEKTRKRKIKK
ncbi:Putative uncharacterized protein [Lacticaseibacillus paracasei]|nr:Putative uncharacterized protein [Lacticaseibacillus paracasei]